MLLLLCLLLLGKIESQVFLDALDGGVQVDLVAVVVKRSLMRYIINRAELTDGAPSSSIRESQSQVSGSAA